jgi:hypothetical protein
LFFSAVLADLLSELCGYSSFADEKTKALNRRERKEQPQRSQRVVQVEALWICILCIRGAQQCVAGAR